MKHIVMFSGGAASWGAAKRVAEKYGTADLILCFADTLMEDEDLYRFLDQAAANVGGEIVRLVEGRTPWEVFRDEKVIGNSRCDPCSRILKREITRKWLNEHHRGANIYFGYDFTEIHRLERAKPHWEGWNIFAPLAEEAPMLTKAEVLDWMRSEGIEPPRLYAMGFPHNNCGGFCVKAGQAHFAKLLREMPERYRYHEEQEADPLFRGYTVMKDRRGGVTKPLSMRDFRLRLVAGGGYDHADWGGCGCFSDPDEG